MSKARWLLGLALAPFLAMAGVFAFHGWLETHLNIHRDGPLIFVAFSAWAALVITTAVAVPGMCWELAGRFAKTRSERRAWRVVIIAANLVGCVLFLVTMISTRASRT